jgi:hypothetical protein
MAYIVTRSIAESPRKGLSTDELSKSEDHGLVVCWDVGRRLAAKRPDLAERAKRGELPELVWKGGVEKELTNPEKYGTLYYLATWQGLRNENLYIDPALEVEHVCVKTGVKVIFTGDSNKYANA